jgi:hypothetical protein
MNKDHQLRSHFDSFVDRDARYPDYILTDTAWTAFKKSESQGKRRLLDHERKAAEPLFGAKWSYEITIQSLWQEMAEYWSMNMGWFLPLRHTIVTGYWGPHHGRRPISRVFLRALFKIRDSIERDSFPVALMAYTGMSMEDKARYISIWMGNNARWS